MANKNLTKAKRDKNDEFYTQWADIEKEVNAYLEFDKDAFRGKTVLLPCDDPEWSNFTKYFYERFSELGLKKLISTSYAADSNGSIVNYQPSLFEKTDQKYDQSLTKSKGKVFTLTARNLKNSTLEDLEWKYLKGDGDFRSDEVKKLRDESDIIITNPPFSLFRDFLAWVTEAEKKFLVIGNMNAITYKEVFPLIKENKVWLGCSSPKVFIQPNGEGKNFGNINWFTNLEHGRRHHPLSLMTLADNLKFSKHKEILGKKEYDKYDNYDAIEVPFCDGIPSDYRGVMGVPISFLDKYCPEQFEILGATESEGKGFSNGLWKHQSGVSQPLVGGARVYKRIFIRHKKYS